MLAAPIRRLVAAIAAGMLLALAATAIATPPAQAAETPLPWSRHDTYAECDHKGRSGMVVIWWQYNCTTDYTFDRKLVLLVVYLYE